MTNSFPLPRLQRIGNGSRHDCITAPYDAEEMRQHIANALAAEKWLEPPIAPYDAEEMRQHIAGALAAENWVVPPIAPSHLPAPEEVAHRLNMLETFLAIATQRLEQMGDLETRIKQIERAIGVDYERHT
jgi:hypothetical protein